MELEESEGYSKLLAAVVKDEGPAGTKQFHDYRGKLAWVVSRAKHYAEKTGLPAADILNAWEQRRNYWYMNYYQDCNQPEIKADSVRIFDTAESMRAAIGEQGFRCPCCDHVSRSPYECDSGVKVDGQPCNWKVYGLFGHMGKGTHVFVKEAMRGENIFMPVAWEPALV